MKLYFYILLVFTIYHNLLGVNNEKIRNTILHSSKGNGSGNISNTKDKDTYNSFFYKGIHLSEKPYNDKREFRGAWIATVKNINWPSSPSKDEFLQKKEYTSILDDMVDLGLNVAIVQIRPSADAFYESSYEPWSRYLTGKQGLTPNYDPLKFMIEEAHKRNIEFHAWFNPFRIASSSKEKEEITYNHPARKNASWVVKYGNGYYFNPGIPDVREYSKDVILEVVKNYDIDAVHMDDYFYPYKIGNTEFPDYQTYKKYNASYRSIDEWRRNNVDKFVSSLSKSIKNEKSHVKFGISPFGVWRNYDKDISGSHTKAGNTNYDDLYADTRKWIENEWLDYIVPQIYWSFGYNAAPYETLVNWWSKEVEDKSNIHLYIGHGAYKIGKKTWEDYSELPNQIKYNRQYFSNVKGSAFYNIDSIRNISYQVNSFLKNDINKNIAIIPTMPWIDNTPPKAPKIISISEDKNQYTKIKWENLAGEDARYFAIYRIPENENCLDMSKCTIIDEPHNILKTIVNNGSKEFEFIDKTYNKNYNYIVTAFDRLHNESQLSNVVALKRK